MQSRSASSKPSIKPIPFPMDPVELFSVGMGLLSELKGDPEAAAKHYGQAIKSNSKSIMALSKRGICLLACGETDKGLKDLDRAVGLGPKIAHTHKAKALGEFASGRFELAVKSFAKATELGLWDSHTALLYYFALKKNNQQGEAFNLLREALDKRIASASWPHPVVQYYAQDISLDTLMNQALAAGKGRMMEVRFYSGIDNSCLNNTKQTLADLSYILEEGCKNTTMVLLAQREIERANAEIDDRFKISEEKSNATAKMQWLD